MSERLVAVEEAVERLVVAARTGVATAPVRDLIGDTDQSIAYAVQNVLAGLRLAAGARVVGYKIGLTSRAVQEQIGVDTPDTGVLFDDMQVADGGTISGHAVLQPKVEVEVAFVLKEDFAVPETGTDLSAPISDSLRLAAAVKVDYAVVALEICDSRVDNWDITITDTIADNASSGLYVLGTRRLRLSDFVPSEVTMTLTGNGEIVSSGSGAACLGDPLIALAWLARTRSALGEPLRAGDIILSGALGPMADARAGITFVGEVSALGRVSVTFAS